MGIIQINPADILLVAPAMLIFLLAISKSLRRVKMLVERRLDSFILKTAQEAMEDDKRSKK